MLFITSNDINLNNKIPVIPISTNRPSFNNPKCKKKCITLYSVFYPFHDKLQRRLLYL